VSGSRSDTSRGLRPARKHHRAFIALVLVLVLAACEHRDPETKPFQIDATRSDGASFVVDVVAFYRFTGTARRLEPTVLLVEGASLPDGAAFDATLRFRPDAPGGVVFPEQLDGAAVTVVLVADPSGIGPDGEELRYPALRIATGADPDLRHQFAMVEAAYTGAGTDIITVGPPEPTDDHPFFRVIADWTEFEPAECGPAYYDALEVLGDDERFTLRHGDRRELSIGAADAAPWKVLHVVSWHRRGTCGAQSEAWTQFAAWR
jgi:hypothetical protein